MESTIGVIQGHIGVYRDYGIGQGDLGVSQNYGYLIGVSIIRKYLGVYIGFPYLWKLPHGLGGMRHSVPRQGHQGPLYGGGRGATC